MRNKYFIRTNNIHSTALQYYTILPKYKSSVVAWFITVGVNRDRQLVIYLRGALIS